MDNHDNHQPSRGRETMLTIMLTLMVGGGFVFFLIMVSGGFFFYVILAALAITGVGAAHYVLWGHSMTGEVAQEKIENAAAAEGANPPQRRWKKHKRF